MEAFNQTLINQKVTEKSKRFVEELGHIFRVTNLTSQEVFCMDDIDKNLTNRGANLFLCDSRRDSPFLDDKTILNDRIQSGSPFTCNHMLFQKHESSIELVVYSNNLTAEQGKLCGMKRLSSCLLSSDLVEVLSNIPDSDVFKIENDFINYWDSSRIVSGSLSAKLYLSVNENISSSTSPSLVDARIRVTSIIEAYKGKIS